MEKELYKKEARQKLDDILYKLKEIEKKKNNTADKDVQKEYEKSIAKLEPKIEKMRKQYDELESRAEEAWNEVKDEYEHNAKVLHDSLSSLLF